MFNYIKFDLFLMSSLEGTGSGGDNPNDFVGPKDNQEARKELTEVEAKILEIKTQILETRAGIKIVGQRKDILSRRAEIEISFAELDEPGAIEINDKVLQLKGELTQLEEKRTVLQRSLENAQNNKLNPEELNKMKTMRNKEFLKYTPQERLRFITIGNVDNNSLKEGGVKDLEFTFTFDGVYNRELYVRTTAGQVLNQYVREVESNGQSYTRRGLNGEFFAANGSRLLIHEGTKLSVTNFGKDEDLKKINEDLVSKLGEYKGTPNEKLALESLEKGYDPKFVINTFGDKLKGFSGDSLKVEVEDLLTDIARFQDDFKEDYPDGNVGDESKISQEFAGYIINAMIMNDGDKNSTIDKIAKTYGFDGEKLRSSRRVNNPSLGGGPLKMENFSEEDKVGLEDLRNKKLFRPGSTDAQNLFLYACKAAGLPEDWAKSEYLHNILIRESNGRVGALNPTFPKSMSPEKFKEVSNSTNANNPFGVSSTASGLGQCILPNVDLYYPDGRKGIGDPLNEAVGMIRYIRDRYGDPKTASDMHGKLGQYTHSVTGKIKDKTFKEGY